MANPAHFYRRIARLALNQGMLAIGNATNGNADAVAANQNNLTMLRSHFERYAQAERDQDDQAMTVIEAGPQGAHHAAG